VETESAAKINFLGASYDADTNISLWNYQVISGDQPSLSHWSIANCQEHEIVAVSDNWIETTESIKIPGMYHPRDLMCCMGVITYRGARYDK